MKHALEPIGRSLIFSECCRATATGIEWLREPTSDELDSDDYTIQRCDDSAGWWMGDVIVKRWQREGSDKTLSEFAAEYARVRGLNEETVRQRANVGGFYPVVERSTRPISWSHHYIIWSVCGGDGLEKCLSWLAAASLGDKGVAWSTGRLREELRAARRSRENDEEPEAPKGEFDELVEVDRCCAIHLPKLKKLDALTAREMLMRFASTVAFVDGLRARAS